MRYGELALMVAIDLKEGLAKTAFAFRGYNVNNLGRSAELLAHSAYGPIVRGCLKRAAGICSEIIGRRVDLVSRVKSGKETTLSSYPDAIGLIMAMEKAQLELLREFFGIQLEEAKVAFGYSLGEISALAACQVIDIDDAMRVPLSLSSDCAELAEDVSLGIFFSQGGALPYAAIHRLCQEISQQGRGTIGISASLAPNSMLLMGQGKTLQVFKQRMSEVVQERPTLRKSSHRFPPLHTPIVWQRCVPNRAAVLMQTIPGGLCAPRPSDSLARHWRRQLYGLQRPRHASPVG